MKSRETQIDKIKEKWSNFESIAEIDIDSIPDRLSRGILSVISEGIQMGMFLRVCWKIGWNS